MFYVTGIVRDDNAYIVGYRLFDLYTYSKIQVTYDEAKEFLNEGYRIANLQLVDDKLELSSWTRDTERYIQGRLLNKEHKCMFTSGLDHWYIFTNKLENGRFRVIDHEMYVEEFNWNQLYRYIKDHKVLNITYSGDTDTIKSFDTYKLHNDAQFVNSIHKKYNRFIQKTAVLGMDCKFSYIIEDNRVILTHYNGTCDTPVLPNFIHFIREGAFVDCNLRSIELNEGLLGIGDYAFMSSHMRQVKLPSSVEFIGFMPFDANTNIIR